ncbi:hypothetical protein L202_07712 [Cryptococcus amylolentus CBS 6039]|uniref:Uncharacterized protein n=1 Tax=Cryptococcus amylolentus CBS 6039 TaxID=1295533 RepID=A0A1E3HBI4_9TREE|nr:hypothetical protein L202_07712 [Cryptococcus amylolentus CBS 6039]ODN73146.1 hypothetical protein L202_07712 [Cryptococcus amylolentus CBS 6039]
MSQSPLARSTRKSLPAFAHAPSKLGKSSIKAEDPPSPASPRPWSDRDSTPSKGTPSKSSQSTPRYRNAGSSTSSPHTPKIHYSPHALATPPQSMSKSASIPFDMAASAKAARRAEEEMRRTPMEQSGKKKRFVRRKPLHERIIGFPQKVVDTFLFHTPASVLDVLPEPHLANPIALGVHVLHCLLVAPLFTAKDDYGSVLQSGRSQSAVSSRWDHVENAGKTGLLGVSTRFFLVALLMALALGNAVYLFTRFRTYDMLLRDPAEAPVHSPHASPVLAPKAKPQADDEEDNVFKAEHKEPWFPKLLRLTGRALLYLVKFTFHAILSAFGKPTTGPSLKDIGASGQTVQSLRVWDPPPFCLAFFSAYPPTAPILTHLLTPINPLLTPVLHLSTTFLLAHLEQAFSQLVKDRMILSAEVMREYDQRFVYKKIFSNKVDRGVSTHESEHVFY